MLLSRKPPPVRELGAGNIACNKRFAVVLLLCSLLAVFSSSNVVAVIKNQVQTNAVPNPTREKPGDGYISVAIGIDGTESRNTNGTHGLPNSESNSDKIIAADAIISRTLKSMVHVTHTHTTSNDTWLAAFSTLEEHGLKSPFGGIVRFVVCVDEMHPSLNQWPWLEVVEYGTRHKNYPSKVASCLRNVLQKYNSTKAVLHTMEDMIPVGPIQWELVAASARILAGTPDARYFRFGCYDDGGLDKKLCDKQKTKGAKKPAQAATVAMQQPAANYTPLRECGTCPTEYTGAFYTNYFSIVPMVVRPVEWMRLHERHAGRRTPSGARMEQYSYSHPEEPGLGLQGFCDASAEVYSTHPMHWPTRRFAYPFMHTGVESGVWQTGHYADTLCPFFEAGNITEAGAVQCKRDLNATPPCLCDDPKICQTENGPMRKFHYTTNPASNRGAPFPLGCLSWREKGRPKPLDVSGAGQAVSFALRKEGLWDAPDLNLAWDALSSNVTATFQEHTLVE